MRSYPCKISMQFNPEKIKASFSFKNKSEYGVNAKSKIEAEKNQRQKEIKIECTFNPEINKTYKGLTKKEGKDKI